ncbi:MAG: type II secretion system minor pseudopilin GspI [Gammaproteobacteria bacterium]
MRRHHRDASARRCAAFTLLEVLAALLVLGIALTAWQLRMAQNLDGAAYLRDKTVATWVALNQLELLRIAQRRGDARMIGELQGSVVMAGATWYWVLAPDSQMSGDGDAVVPVTVGVSAASIEAARSEPLVALTGVSHAWR